MTPEELARSFREQIEDLTDWGENQLAKWIAKAQAEAFEEAAKLVEENEEFVFRSLGPSPSYMDSEVDGSASMKQLASEIRAKAKEILG